MKKLLVALIAVAFVFGLVAQTAVAEERLSLNGQMRVRAFYKDNNDLDSDADDTQNYWDQRFRLGATIAPADGVKAVLRCDFGESVWGADDQDDGSSNQDLVVQTDRAYLDITKGMIHLTAGLQPFALGNAVAYDAQHTGIGLTIKTPLTITLVAAKVDEDTTDSGDLTDEDGFEDIDHYALNLGYATDAFTVNVFYALQNDGRDDGISPNVIGVQGTFAIGPVNINAEINSFGGTNDIADIDYCGLQFWAVGTMSLSDALTLGAAVVYSDGNNDADKEKLTYLTDDGSTVYADLGMMNTLISGVGPDDIFDPLSTDAGSIGGGIFAQFVPVENVTLFGNISYLTQAEELDATGEFESALVVNLSAKWAFTQAAAVEMQYHYVDATLADDVDTDPLSRLGMRLHVDW